MQNNELQYTMWNEQNELQYTMSYNEQWATIRYNDYNDSLSHCSLSHCNTMTTMTTTL